MDLILGAPRRRWARGEKLAAVAATFSPGMTVTAAARELGISRSMLFAWRKKFRAEAARDDRDILHDRAADPHHGRR